MLAIGRALMSNPEIILFDEISLGLAPIIIKNIYKVLPSIVKDGMSAIIIEQDITKAIQNSNRLYCLQEGKISLNSNSNSISQEEITKAYFGM
jgi:branched-chain amino acid transport system ATP-binding protein